MFCVVLDLFMWLLIFYFTKEYMPHALSYIGDIFVLLKWFILREQLIFLGHVFNYLFIFVLFYKREPGTCLAFCLFAIRFGYERPIYLVTAS
jgi:hypothetical protein